MAETPKFRSFLIKLSVALAGLFLVGAIGSVTTKLVVPDQIANAPSSEKQVLQRALVFAQICFDSPIQILPAIRYKISVSENSVAQLRSTQDAFESAGLSIRAFEGDTIQLTGEVIAYTLFAMPLYKVSMQSGSCKIL